MSKPKIRSLDDLNGLIAGNRDRLDQLGGAAEKHFADSDPATFNGILALNGGGLISVVNLMRTELDRQVIGHSASIFFWGLLLGLLAWVVFQMNAVAIYQAGKALGRLEALLQDPVKVAAAEGGMFSKSTLDDAEHIETFRGIQRGAPGTMAVLAIASLSMFVWGTAILLSALPGEGPFAWLN